MQFFCYTLRRMDIAWHGLSCFTLTGKSGTVVTDPFDAKEVGLSIVPKLEADVVLSNIDFPRHRALSNFGKETRVFDWPGEYESKNIIIQGISAFDRPREKESGKEDHANRAIIFTIKLDGFKICHLSNLGHKLTPEILEAIGDVDILLIPVGGHECLDAAKAHEVIEQLDPRIVIPMYYKTDGVKLPLAGVEAFLKEVGIHAPEREKIAKFQSTSNLPQDKTEFKVLEPVL